MKIYIKQFNEDAGITILPQGDWFDLNASVDVTIKKGEIVLVPLGVAMRMPRGIEALLTVRSSTPRKYKIVQVNCPGVIDNSFNGNNDQWCLQVQAFEDTTIKAGTRLAQFRFQLSQRAGFFDKLAWLIDGRPSFEFIDDLTDENRGGFGQGTGE
jgi:dUTP pyrophosphatase